MIIKINGRELLGDVVDVIEIKGPTTLEKVKDHIKRNYPAYLTAGYTILMLAQPGITPASAVAAAAAVAPDTLGGGARIIVLMQKAAFWVGLGVTIWGIVEAQLDYPGWKGRVGKGVLGYIGILVLPLVFMELRNSLQIDVWQQIQSGAPLSPAIPAPAAAAPQLQ